MFTAQLGKFDGQSDRFLRTEDGGLVRFVAPKDGFNSHEYNNKRPKMGWAEAACFQRNQGFIVSSHITQHSNVMSCLSILCISIFESYFNLLYLFFFISFQQLHTKEWQKEVPENSATCAASNAGQLTTSGGEHLFGKWGGCQITKTDCHDRLTLRSAAKGGVKEESVDVSGYTPSNKTSFKSILKKKNKGAIGLSKYLSPDKSVKRVHVNTSLPPHPHSLLYKSENDGVVISNFTSPVKCSLSSTSTVTKLSPNDRYGVLAIPKTATTSLTKMMMKAGLSSSCGGVLWQSSEPGACPMSQQVGVSHIVLLNSLCQPLLP